MSRYFVIYAVLISWVLIEDYSEYRKFHHIPIISKLERDGTHLKQKYEIIIT
jgi:hypothetical protein